MGVFFNDTATTEIYTLSLHDALPIVWAESSKRDVTYALCNDLPTLLWFANQRAVEYHPTLVRIRSEEHTSELQSRQYLVCRLLLEKKSHASRSTTQWSHNVGHECGNS